MTYSANIYEPNTKSYVCQVLRKHLGNRNKKGRKKQTGGEKIRDSMELETSPEKADIM